MVSQGWKISVLCLRACAGKFSIPVVSCLTVLTLKLCFILIGQCFVFLCLLSYLEELLFDLGGLVGVRVFESVEFCLEILSLLF